MFPVLEGLLIVSLAELLLWTLPIWKARRIAAISFAAALAAGSLALLVMDPAAWTALIALLTVYRCMNLARVAAGRVQEDYLFHASRRTAAWLIIWQAAVAGMAVLSRHYGIGPAEWWALTAAVVLIGSDIILFTSTRNLRAARPPELTRPFTDKELPALTVAIPARNETEDLEECLRSLIASTYPKLEILVLDDCSQNKRTPEIIRGFAHAGVRFIAGDEPPKSWLAKNFAYDKLADEASGDVLLFCGVDVRFKPGSLDALVRTLLQKKKGMISILPHNTEPRRGGLSSWFMQANRYAWELTLPRRMVRRPPVLSTCWLIHRQALERAGGFEAVRRRGVPESYFARALADIKGYGFLMSGPAMGVSSVKAPREQRATAIRTRYLQMHRRPEMTALVGLAESAVLVMPFALLAASLVVGQWLTAGLSALSIIANVMVYSRIFNLTYRRFLLKGLWLLPFAALYDVWLLNYSMWRYEFRDVIWKGRNVCIPVMRVIPKLPEA
ncbi:MAG TPA: glycosyltransferase family A protein [Candidatus Saccharimonadales bacterium]|nr:glycosyltransferase family A protein [Candidatus Saccharimonadales bacterium]